MLYLEEIKKNIYLIKDGKKSRFFTWNFKEWVRATYRAGFSTTEIAKAVGISQASICDILVAVGLYKRTKKGPRKNKKISIVIPKDKISGSSIVKSDSCDPLTLLLEKREALALQIQKIDDACHILRTLQS
jgi:hypothetical protein